MQAQVDPYLVREAARRVAVQHRNATVEVERCAAIARKIRDDFGDHKKQIEFYDDRGPQVAALCTRQAGKTDSTVGGSLDTALTKPGSYSVYFNTSKDECRNIVWENPDDVGLLAKLEKYKVPCKVNDTRMTVFIPAMQSRIKLIGVDDQEAMRKARGPTYDFVTVDEAQDFPNLKEFALSDIGPGTIKRRGSLRLTGTPGRVCAGYFYDVTRDDGDALPGWNVHRFTIYDNPGIPHAAEYVESLRIANGWDLDEPQLMREYHGKWVSENSSMVYRLASASPSKVYYDALPSDRQYDWRYLIGVDLGFHPDPFAIVVWAYCEDIPVLFEVDSDYHEGTDTAQQANIIASLCAKYKPERVVCDAGSGGLKQIVEADWQRRYGLPVDVAQKAHKESAIEAFNSDLVAGRIKLQRDGKLARQMLVLPWKNKIGARKVEHPKFRNDMCDAALYAYRESTFFEGAPRPQPVDQGAPEFEAHRMTAYKEELLAAYDEDSDIGGLYDLEGDGWENWNR